MFLFPLPRLYYYLKSWIEVVPQLISHLDSRQNSGLLVWQLVVDISKVHPQAIVYALTAATKSRKSQRSKVAKEILEIVAESRPTLVEQAVLINGELIRCAILWHEQWHEVIFLRFSRKFLIYNLY
jgi:FKBP12-rapamycin complex-associated protein